MTRDIVGVVAPRMLDAEMQRARRKDPQSLDSWEAAVRAQWHLSQLTREDNAEALRLALKSARQNPADTAGLNIAPFAHIYDALFGWSASAGQSFTAANEAARKAVSFDSRDEVSQTALGSSELFLGQIDCGVDRLRGAIALNPSFSWAHGNLGVGLIFTGQLDQAVESLKEALRLSPIDRFTFLWIYVLGLAHFLSGRNEVGLDLAERSLRERAGFPGPYRVRAACLSEMGRIDEARKSIEQFMRLAPNATLGNLRMQVPLRRDADYERYANALRRAGLPE
jgi:tetratricopeptide (TPR) repeat protein